MRIEFQVGYSNSYILRINSIESNSSRWNSEERLPPLKRSIEFTHDQAQLSFSLLRYDQFHLFIDYSFISNVRMDKARQQTEAALSQIRNKQIIPTIDFTVHVQDDGTTVSTTERIIKEVQCPAVFKPTSEQFFSNLDPTKPDISFLKNHFYREGRLTDEQAIFIITEASKILRAEPNLLEVDAPITVCGDIHGQYVRIAAQKSIFSTDDYNSLI